MRTKQLICAVNDENGFTLVEVMIALVIFSIGILGVAAMQINFIQGNATARGVTEAANQASGKMEDLVALSYASVASSNETVGDYTLNWTVSHPDPDASGTVNGDEDQFKLIQLTASWNDGGDARSFGMEMMRVENGQQ
jgi:type IV pilus assembly protein PilV